MIIGICCAPSGFCGKAPIDILIQYTYGVTYGVLFSWEAIIWEALIDEFEIL